MYHILLIVIAVIVYGSLYPFDFHSAQLAASPLWVLIHSWPTAINRFVILGIALNLLIYIPLGVFGFLAFRQNLGGAVAATAAIAIGLILPSSIEMIQLFDDERDCSASDVVCNVTGTVIGVALGTFYQRWLKQSISGTRAASFLHANGAVLLVYAWLAYHVLFATASLSPLDTFTYFVEWLVLAQLLAAVVGREKARKWFTLLLLVLPARLFIVGRTFTWSELLGATLACICSYFLSASRWRLGFSAVLLILVLILRGLAPITGVVLPTHSRGYLSAVFSKRIANSACRPFFANAFGTDPRFGYCVPRAGG